MSAPPPVRLHLGCGKRFLPGWTHVDIIHFNHIDVVCDVRRLDTFADGSVAEIYGSHVLEHFKRQELDLVLREWRRVLVPGGLLRLAVPDFAAIVEVYRETASLERLQGLLYGGQTYDQNFHHIAFDFASLGVLLTRAGFIHVERYRWQDFLPHGYDDFSRAYVPHLDASGRLMSLNVTARTPA